MGVFVLSVTLKAVFLDLYLCYHAHGFQVVFVGVSYFAHFWVLKNALRATKNNDTKRKGTNRSTRLNISNLE